MFQSARIKLTGWYLLIIMSVSLAFSGVIYTVLTREMVRFDSLQRFKLERRLEEGGCYSQDGIFRRPPIAIIINNELLSEAQNRILYVLFVVNGIVLLFSGGLGYLLAGRTLEPIRRMVDSQNRFISDASHELRTPLTSLKSTFEVFLRNKKRNMKEADLLIDESILEVDKLQRLSDSLLTLSHLEEKDVHLPMESVSTRTVINNAIKKLKHISDRKNISLKIKGDNATLLGISESLEELFVIILDNALKYSPRDSVVSIRTSIDKGYGKIAISDEGDGIKDIDMPFVFDRFYRSDKSRTSGETGGYGLGLSIAKKIVAMHNGSIRVYNNKGRGATFEVILPLFSK